MSSIELKRVSMVLLDISGYTKFIKWHEMSLIHAEQIISDLLESAIGTLDNILKLNKLEGDAAFLYAELEINDTNKPNEIVKNVQLSFDRFNKRQKALIRSGEGGCPCEACCKIDSLKLKAIIHQGEVAVKRMRQFEELAGKDVIIIHRLLKNSLDSSEYILITDNFHQLCGEVGINENGSNCEPDMRIENCEGVGEIKVIAYYPDCDKLPKPVARRVSKYSGFTESMRLWRGSLWKRLTFQRRSYNNLPK